MPRAFRPKQRLATITTAGNKVQLTQSITAAQALLHPENPNPSHPEGVGTPHGSRELSSELVVWYYPPGRHVNAKNNKKRFATRPKPTQRRPQQALRSPIWVTVTLRAERSQLCTNRHLIPVATMG